MSNATTDRNELAALEIFKGSLGEQYLRDELDSYQRQDANLLRWLQARDLDIDKAIEMLKTSMEWRKENKVDEILSWKRPDIFQTGYEFLAPGTDKDECLISIIPFGKWDLRGAVEAGHRDDLIKYSNQILELGFRYMRAESTEDRTLCQFVAIFDWDGFSLNQIMSSPTVEALMECLKIFEQHYPENLKEVFVINAPTFFEIVFNLLKPFVTAKTLSKLRIFGTNTEQWRAALLENISTDELPSHYGGSNTACKNYDFNDGIAKLKKAPELPANTFKTLCVAASDKLVVDCPVTVPNTVLTWNFKSEWYDLGFQFLKEDEEIFACQRTDSHLHLQKGLYVCKEPGLYKLCFDNSFSTFRSKTVQYSIQKGDPEVSTSTSQKSPVSSNKVDEDQSPDKVDPLG